MTVIKNGSTGDTLIINTEGQASVLSESLPQSAHNSNFGRTFVIESGFISSSATADTTSAILFIKNTSTTKNLYFGLFRTCNEAAMKWIMKTGATALSSETPVTPQNSQIGNALILDATVNMGAQNATVTGGTEFATWINGTGHSIPNNNGALILGANQTLTLECLPFASVAAEVCVTIECWQV